jgi:hypothetical protein
MKNNNIFKEKLYHHTIPPRDGLWEAIEAQLPPKKDQRIFPFFWFTLFATTLLAGGLMIGLFHNSEGTFSPSSLKQSAPAPAHKQSETATSPTAITLINGQRKDQQADQQLAQQQEQQLAQQQIHNQAITSPKTAKTDIPSTSQSSKKTNQGSLGAANTLRTPTASDRAFGDDLTSNAQPNPYGSYTSSPTTSQFRVVPFLPLADLLLEAESTASGIASLKPDPNCYKFTGPGSNYALSADVFGGPGFSPKSYEQISGENSAYADARKSTESNQYAWSVGGRINLHHRSGLTGRLGITYSQTGDLFDYSDSLATQSTTRIDSFFAADGTFLYEETSQVLIPGTLVKKIHNTYRYLDIPLLVGFELPLGRSNLMLNCGPVLNLTSSQEGQILDSMLHPRSITQGDPGAIDVYKTSLGWSIYLGAGVLFPISDHFSGLVEPSFLYRLNPVTLSSYPLQERRHYANLNLGLRYHFN